MSFATQKPTHYISPEDIKVLKEALKHHVKASESLKQAADGFMEMDFPSVAKTKREQADFHTRIAEALRRVVG